MMIDWKKNQYVLMSNAAKSIAKFNVVTAGLKNYLVEMFDVVGHLSLYGFNIGID